MGFFSNAVLNIAAILASIPDVSYPADTALPQWRLAALYDMLANCRNERPRDPMHPLYDRHFYSHHLTQNREWPCTVQGLLQAIADTEAEIRQKKPKHPMQLEFLSTAHAVSTDRGEQVVLTSMFLPEATPVIFP